MENSKFKNDEQLKEMAEVLASHWMTKVEIKELFNFQNIRHVRRRVEEIANVLPVISSSSRPGYKIANETDTTEEIKRADRELELKIKALQARRKPLQRELKRRGA